MIKNIILGIMLGLAVMIGYFFYPEESGTKPAAVKQAVEQAALGQQKDNTESRGEDIEEIDSSQKQDTGDKRIVKKDNSFVCPAAKPAAQPASETSPDAGEAVKETGTAEPGSLKEENPLERLTALIEKYSPENKPLDAEDIRQVDVLERIRQQPVKPSQYADEETLWRELLKTPMPVEYLGGYPLAECFDQTAIETGVPVALMIGMAGFLTHFNKDAAMDDRFGIMGIRWPDPARDLGMEKKEDLLTDACENIRLGGRFLAQLIEKSKNGLVPALIAYKNQSENVRPEYIQKEEVLFSKRLRKYVETMIKAPYTPEIMYAFWEFDKRPAAETFAANIESMTDIRMWVGQKDFKFMVYIPAADEADKERKTAIIKDKTGIVKK